MNKQRNNVTLSQGDIVNVTRITDKLYLGGIIYDIGTFKRFVEEEGIDAILSVWDDEMLPTDELGVSRDDYMYVYISDNEQANIMQYFGPTYDFLTQKIDDENKRVFVHCHAGLSRSATVVICYLMQRRHLSLTDAYNHVLERRKIKPNNSFIRQLQMHESNLNMMAD
jgi:protein-tyrosine phosphatase